MTNTEKVIAKLNYHSATKDPDSFVSAMEGIIDIYVAQASNRLTAAAEVSEFEDMLSIVKYIGNKPEKYQSIVGYYNNRVLEISNLKNVEESYDESHIKVA